MEVSVKGCFQTGHFIITVLAARKGGGMEIGMEIEIGFGTKPQMVHVPDENLIGILKPNKVEVTDTGSACVEKALLHPIGLPRLSQMVKYGQKIAIIISDITRPVPSYKILPALLGELRAAGVCDGDITIVVALGSHRKETPEEIQKLVGEDVFNRIKCVNSSNSDFVSMGVTSRGTPVDICRPVAEADFRIATGNIEYHYFAGYSGGAKAIMPGVSTRAAIQANHCRMIQPDAKAGKLDGNPVREDIEEAAEICRLDYIVNVVLDEHKQIIYAVAGDRVEAHRAGCAFLDALYQKRLERRADIVIASQGGAPKDLNLYQTQKALDNAKHAVKEGGIIILVGSCQDGLGEGVFEEWMTKSSKPRDMIERIKNDFQLGGHKAAAIAMVLENADIYLVSELEASFVESIFLKPFNTVQSALEAAFARLGMDASVLVMPWAGATLPMVHES